MPITFRARPFTRNELKRFWPLSEKHRKAKIARFAKKHGFRLRFYNKGLFAIFDTKSPKQDKKLTIMMLPLRGVLQPIRKATEYCNRIRDVAARFNRTTKD